MNYPNIWCFFPDIYFLFNNATLAINSMCLNGRDFEFFREVSRETSLDFFAIVVRESQHILIVRWCEHFLEALGYGWRSQHVDSFFFTISFFNFQGYLLYGQVD